MSRVVEDDQFSDAPDTLEDERYEDLPTGIQQVQLHDIESPDKTIAITSGQGKDENPDSAPSRGPSISSTADQAVETASAHSLPAVTVSHHLPTPEPHSSRTVSSTASAYIPPPSPARSHNSARPSTVSADDRRPRRRSATTESRTPNRLSGFFNNLIHRREHTPNTEGSIREEHASQPEKAEGNSRPSSPPLRPSTPPPDLPPPSLQELGLCLSVLTSDLSPAHFSAPPSSGAFLAPHYLLLCHAQGLDVLPLISPPAPQPYALVRRVSFRSVVVMEQRGVLVAIAGRRDGVRVYALEEVKRAVEWRIEVELRRERERQRREASKKTPVFGRELPDARNSTDKHSKSSSLTSSTSKAELLPAIPLIPRTPLITRRPKSRPSSDYPPVPVPSGHPPPYASPLEHSTSIQNSLSPPLTRARGTSVSDVLTAGAIRRNTNATIRPENPDSKAEWVESSDDEAINIVAAGSSGSQALDERTSSTGQQHTTPALATRPTRHTHSPSITRRNRPANLDLTLSRTSSIPPPEPSPAPTLLTLRQALTHSPSREPREFNDPDTPVAEVDEDDDDGDGISLSQVLQESRLPNLPPPGTRQAQQPILLASTNGDSDDVASPRSSDVQSSNYHGSVQEPDDTTPNRRRRWSVIIGQSSSTSSSTGELPAASSTGNMRERMLTRSTSFRSNRSATTVRPSSSPTASLPSSSTLNAPPLPDSAASIISSHSSRSRFIPRILTNAFHNRRGDDRPSSPSRSVEETTKRSLGAPVVTQSPPPKLEYVKLPGTKGALLVKAVETAKKSFLAILCGENGEKVELFAGTYRTALGLSRTFILPDSPRSLELQLQGDDLVEVFLVFSQNVFGLEPATVRVREVRIGRAERRAARRRAREVRTADAPANDSEPQLTEEDNTNVNVSIGVSVAVGSTVVATGTGPEGQQTPPLIAQEHPNHASERAPDSAPDRPSTPVEPTTTSTVAHPEEIVALATAQMGPYTTFQQLSFAPQFPLASIADEYVIPPTYPDFIDYRTEHEPEPGSDLAQVQFSPPGLPVPTPSAPSKWFYRDPKNVIHGPWKASLMQAWYKDGLLPPDLPVRREEDTEFMLLKDLRLQSIDPTHPFRSVVPPAQPEPPSIFQASDKPLLKPISLLAQPRHFGPPALFFSSRGGHSTTIVDNRGRSVLKGRFMWSKDEEDTPVTTTKKTILPTRMGDVKRLEAFDVKDRSVLVAMRQGGLEAVDLSDALLRPGDESRTALPQFHPTPSNYNRRGPFVWKMGTPISGSTASTLLPSKLKNSHIPSKKMSTGSTKSPSGRTEFNVGYVDNDMQDEVLFLGRKGDEIYICERNAGSFRILRLCPV